jgi:choloylglycine hydrolase
MCTGIRLKAQDNSIIYARTLEFAQEINSEIIFIPRHCEFIGTDPRGKPNGLKWTTKYAVLGANAEKLSIVIDGVNEKGLAGGLFYFPGYAQYQEVPTNQTQNSIAPWELMTFILSTCQSIAEVKKILPTIYVNSSSFAQWGITPPVHAIVHDENGSSLVIEYVNGVLHTYDNPIGVFTNSPTFDWHTTNLNNYVNLGAFNTSSKELNGLTLKPLGQGSGMMGLPGDFTSPSRFVRAVVYSQSVVDLKDADNTKKTAFHVLNLFDISRGFIRQQEKDSVSYERTQWTSACDLKNRRYYYKTYETQIVQEVDLLKMDVDAKQTVILPN